MAYEIRFMESRLNFLQYVPIESMYGKYIYLHEWFIFYGKAR